MAIDVNSTNPAQPSIDNNIGSSSGASSTQKTIEGLSKEENSDPNKIIVTIADTSTPIVVLFGPPACGKTMTLVRMTRYLVSQGYTVTPVRTFRPTSDSHYAKMCNDFNFMINRTDAAASTSLISFMLVMVSKKGRPICQILEAPGEYYFDPNNPNAQFPVYVNSIIRAANRKVWTLFVEPNWNDATPRADYATKIGKLKTMMATRDSVLFLYNKIDATHLVYAQGQVNVQQAELDVANNYPRIFVPFLNQNPITKWWKKYNCKFVPFQTGTYNKATDGTLTYTEGPDVYPKKLWNVWLKLING